MCVTAFGSFTEEMCVFLLWNSGIPLRTCPCTAYVSTLNKKPHEKIGLRIPLP